jgi:hypothetical protein
VRGRIRRRLRLRSPLTIALRARRADDEVVATLSPRAGRGGKRGEDRVEHTKGIAHDLGIPEAQDSVAALDQPRIACGVIGTVCMLAAVGLDDQPRLAAAEIRHVGADALLPDELESGETTVAETKPEAAFGLGLVVPKPFAKLTPLVVRGAHISPLQSRQLSR